MKDNSSLLNNSNYAWFYFKKRLSRCQRLKVSTTFEKELNSFINSFKFSNSDYSFIISNITHSKSFFEISLSIKKQLGEFVYSKPTIQLLMGLNNFVAYIPFFDFNQFPTIVESDLEKFAIFFLQLIQIIDSICKTIWNFQLFKSYLLLKGHHNCILNCGNCCDGYGHTKSKFAGGQYCPALTSIGKYCLYHLGHVKFSKGNQICLEYQCGMISIFNDSLKYQIGCGVNRFQPYIHLGRMNEIFKILENMNETNKNFKKSFTIQKKFWEIQFYQKIVQKCKIQLEKLYKELNFNKIDENSYMAFLKSIEENEFNESCKLISFIPFSMILIRMKLIMVILMFKLWKIQYIRRIRKDWDDSYAIFNQNSN